MTTGVSQASTSFTSRAYMQEAVFGITPTTGTPRFLRGTGGDLGYNFTLESSPEINHTRQVPDAVIVDASATGGITFAAQYAEYDPFIEALLCNTFTTFGTGGARILTVTINSAANTITDTAAGATGFVGLVAGQWFSVRGSVSNDGHYLIASVTSSVITVNVSTPFSAPETSTINVRISSTRITNGVNPLRTFTIEDRFTDVGRFTTHRGRAISSMELSFTTGSTLTGSFGTIGRNTVYGNTTRLPAAPVASHSFGTLSAVTGVGRILVRNQAGASILGGAHVFSMNVNINGALREQKALGFLGASGIGGGTFEMTGTLEVYLLTGDLYDAALASQLISISFPVVDSAGNGYAYTFANVKLNVPSTNISAKDQDVLLSVPFTAVAPNTLVDRMVAIDRFGAAIV